MSTEVFFIHGFTGDEATWGELPRLLRESPDLTDCYFRTWSYPTKLNLGYVVSRYLWKDDPNIYTIGQGLRTELTHPMQERNKDDKIVLIGHSMGGLVIQALVLEELANGRRELVDRITEIILFGTPSNGLKKASLLKNFNNQIADMDAFGTFIEKLRQGWAQHIDDQRSAEEPPVPFRLTLVAGLQDRFVPRRSSLDPFPFDEKEFVRGDHVSMVKPQSSDALVCRVIKARLKRGGLTAHERRLILGETDLSITNIARIRAAMNLGDADDLVDLYDTIKDKRLPKVHRELGLALLAHSRYQQAADTLKRYLSFKMPSTDTLLFANDFVATQQLAIALSGDGEYLKAATVLEELDPEIRGDPETIGIVAGRIKRRWLQTSDERLGQRALKEYVTGFNTALEEADFNGIIYNGINAAYMKFALCERGYESLAKTVLATVDRLEAHDYWAGASRAEALLLLDRVNEARVAYEELKSHVAEPRDWGSTGRQALDIRERKERPSTTDFLVKLFDGVSRKD